MTAEETDTRRETQDEVHGDLHRQIALFLLACHRSEYGEHPHPVEVRWMASVIRRITSQRNQTIGFNLKQLEERVREELGYLNLPQEEKAPIISWTQVRLNEVQAMLT